MDLQKIALIGAYLSFLWFVPVLYISKKPFEWKIKKLRMFTFLPTIGAFLFVVGVSIQLFLDKEYMSLGFNQFNFLVMLFLFLQVFVTIFMELALNNYQKKLNTIESSKVRKVEHSLYLGLTILFVLDILVRFEIYRLTF